MQLDMGTQCMGTNLFHAPIRPGNAVVSSQTALDIGTGTHVMGTGKCAILLGRQLYGPASC